MFSLVLAFVADFFLLSFLRAVRKNCQKIHFHHPLWKPMNLFTSSKGGGNSDSRRLVCLSVSQKNGNGFSSLIFHRSKAKKLWSRSTQHWRLNLNCCFWVIPSTTGVYVGGELLGGGLSLCVAFISQAEYKCVTISFFFFFLISEIWEDSVQHREVTVIKSPRMKVMRSCWGLWKRVCCCFNNVGVTSFTLLS